MGLFREVACYGMERDTARLDVTSNAADEIRFSLSDDMDDTLFAFPLTIKVRLPDEWPDVSATQRGTSVEARILEHDTGRFALVKAIPDHGEVRLVPKQ